jgi:hypothetical protein
VSFTVPTSGAVYNSRSLRRLLLEIPSKGRSGAVLDFDPPLLDAIGGIAMIPGGQSHFFIPSRLSQVFADSVSPGTRISESVLRYVCRVAAMSSCTSCRLRMSVRVCVCVLSMSVPLCLARMTHDWYIHCHN